MGLSVNTNVAAINSYRNLSATQNSLAKSLEKLSSGFRINRAADDAAGLAISEGLRAQISGLTQAARNAQDGISVVQTAEGSLTEVHAILHRMRTLAVQAANDSNSEAARANIASEGVQLQQELDRIAKSTNFNGTTLLDKVSGGTGAVMNFQVGAAGDTDSRIAVDLSSANVASVATAVTFATTAAGTEALNLFSHSGAQAAISAIDAQISNISTARANLGAYQNRFEHTIKSVNVAVENLSASESRIRDTDMASEMVNFTKSQILSQAGTAMLAQANSIPQGVLQLLR
ncbi:MAG: flagellin [Micrococcales bacterium]|nr:flagellin [Micrococcales bacterium]